MKNKMANNIQNQTHKIMTKEIKEQEESLTAINDDIIASLVLNGDLSKMKAEQKVSYYKNFCESLGLNPLTQPFAIIKFNNKEILYATKDATEQLRKVYGVSVIESNTKIDGNLCITSVKVQDKAGRYDIATGVVSLPADANGKANAIMKAETKAKRRATLSICGLGLLDESETDTIGKFETVPIAEIQNVKTEEVKNTENNTNGSQFYIELKNKIRESLGGKMNVKEALAQLNKLTGYELDKFPTDEKQCENLLAIIIGKEQENGNRKGNNNNQ